MRRTTPRLSRCLATFGSVDIRRISEKSPPRIMDMYRSSPGRPTPIGVQVFRKTKGPDAVDVRAPFSPNDSQLFLAAFLVVLAGDFFALVFVAVLAADFLAV